jgi:hypothetical protein
MTALWDIAPRSFVVDRCFRGAYCLHHQGHDSHGSCYRLVRTSETSAYFYETTRLYIPEGYSIHFLFSKSRIRISALKPAILRYFRSVYIYRSIHTTMITIVNFVVEIVQPTCNYYIRITLYPKPCLRNGLLLVNVRKD